MGEGQWGQRLHCLLLSLNTKSCVVTLLPDKSSYSHQEAAAYMHSVTFQPKRAVRNRETCSEARSLALSRAQSVYVQLNLREREVKSGRPDTECVMHVHNLQFD